MCGELSLLSQLRLGDPNAQRDEVADNDEDDDGGNQDSNNVPCHNTRGVLLKIKKWIHIESLSRMCEVGQAKIEG